VIHSDGFGFLYAQGKNLRPASLSDVENSECWDFDTVRALMGSGALYVLKGSPDNDSSSDSEEESDKVSKIYCIYIPINYS